MFACPDPEVLRRLLADQLEEREFAALTDHLDSCSACRQLLDQLSEDPDSQRWRSLRTLRVTDDDPATEVLLRWERAGLQAAATWSESAGLATAPPFAPAGYDVLGEIGRGGIGVVYKARHRGLNRIVALKVLLAADHAPAEERTRFQVEAQAAARLQHPAIVQIYEVGEAQDRPFLALEFVEGPSLARHVRGQLQSPAVAAELVAALAQAVQFAHSQGVVHRDLKPGNVLLQPIPRPHAATPSPEPTSEFRPKITDFGLAKLLDQPDCTETGRILGTPGYMAPEQARGQSKAVGPAADIYALGAILYELLTGRPPFQGLTPVDTLLQVLHDEPLPPHRLQPKLPRDLETICLKCLQKNPTARYPTAAALAEDLRRFLEGRPVLARRIGPLTRSWRWCRRNPVPAGLVVALLLAVATAFAGVTWGYISAAAARRYETAARLEETRQRDQVEQALYYSRIALAEREWLANSVARAEDLLDRCLPTPGLPDRRGFEWYYLKRLCRADLRTIPAHPGLHVRGVILTPDGQHLITAAGRPDYARLGTEQGGLSLWTATGRFIGSFDGFHGQVISFTLARDGTRLLTLCSDKKTYLWEVPSRRKLAVFDTVPTDGITPWAAFSPDGHTIALPTPAAVELRDATTGRLLQRLDGVPSPECIAFHPAGTTLATSDRSGTVRLWELAHRRELWQVPARPPALAFSPDGSRLAVPDQDAIRLYDTTTGRELNRLHGHNGTVRNLVWLPEGPGLVTVANDQTVRLWDTSSGREQRVYRGHTTPVMAIACSPDGSRLASGDAAGLVKLWDAHQDQRAVLLAKTPEAAALRFDPTGQRLLVAKVSGWKFGGVRIFDLAHGTIAADHSLDLVRRAEWPLRYVDFSPDGRFLAGPTGTDPKTVGIWETTTGQQVATARSHSAEVRFVAFSADGRQLATAAWNRPLATAGELALWQIRPSGQLQLMWLSPTPSPVDCLAFSPTNQYLLAADRGHPLPDSTRGVDGRLVLWDLSTGQAVRSWSAHRGRVQSVAVSPDGTCIASAGREPGTGLRIWEPETGRLRQDWPAPPQVTVVRFNPMGTRLAAAGYEGTVQLWDPVTGQDILTLRSPVGQITESEANDTDIAFSPDGTRLAVNCWTKAICLFNAEPLRPHRPGE
jgi:WD40 repeat protein/tRNA A-37 threonylcarbamoyl transferase component Bud32